MTEKAHVPLGVGFYPDWFYAHYGISFDRQYYFDPETRVEARREIDKRLYERFGDVGLGNADPEPKPLITFGMVMLPAVFGCEIVFEDDALPWAMPLNLSEKEVMKLAPPDLLRSYPMTEMVKQIEHLERKYGRVVGDINVAGVQNLALKIRGDQLYVDYFENPGLCRRLLDVCAQTVIQLFEFNRKVTGTGAVDVTPMCDPKLCVLPNCTIEQISLDTYEKFVLEHDVRVAEACRPIGVHHCGSVNEALDGYAKIPHLEFIEIGFGSDVKRTRRVFGPDVAVNARINPVLMKNGAPEEVEAEVRRLIDEGAPLHNFSIDTVGLTYGTPDENVRRALQTAKAYGRIRRDPERPAIRLSGRAPAAREEALETSVWSARERVTIGPSRPLVVIGERINPSGRRDLREALERGDFGPIRAEALEQAAHGARILDVNAGVSGMDEPRLLKAAVTAVSQAAGAPLCIDSALPAALQAALEVYEGKALVNSVNGEKEKLDRILPLVKAHGAAVIALTMDEEGIPATAEKRLDIARRIVERAERMGIPRSDVIIDPLAMAVSADHRSALETLRALQLIREELGVNQVLGLSNVSFGLPERASLNAAFLAMAASNGMTCAIADPTAPELRKAVLAADALLGRDEHCLHYIARIEGKDRGAEEPDAPGSDGGKGLEALKEAVVSGRRKEAVAITLEALTSGEDPRRIIDAALVPALNLVGERFEKKKIFVPEMMISAKSMQACMDEIKPFMKMAADAALGVVVIGTVLGDLHDIGKNLTKLLLETAGFKVIDLGENVPPEAFVAAARESGAQIVGLSSLLTTGDPHVEATVRAVKASDVGDRVKVICGGAALTLKFVEACGADAYAKDAAEGVKRIKDLMGTL